MYINDKNAQLKRLKDIKTRADQGIRTTEDYKSIVNILIKLVKSVECEQRE